MKRDKLYTANRWNQPAFMSANRFNWGGLAAADKKANPWDYADDVDTTQQYMDSKNVFGLSKKDNPFSKGNLAGGIGAMANTGIGKGVLGAVGAVGNRVAYNAISGGLSSGAGKAVGNFTNTIGGALANVNPVIGMGVQVIGGAIGGGINALGGTSTDAEKKAANDAGTAALNNFVSNAASFDEIKGPQAVANVQDAHKSGAWRKGWARKRNAADRQARIEAQEHASNSMRNNINNIALDQFNDAMSDYYAFGGPLDDMMDNNMGAVEYGFMTDYLNEKRRQNDLKNKMTGVSQMPAFMQNGFALGGDIQTHGADWTTGSTHVNAGGSHEESPYDGVQMGVDSQGIPNLVEEGEVVFNDYVYSQRIFLDNEAKEKLHFPKKAKISYADAAKRLEKEIKERPNDVISKSGFEAQMASLADEQERQKQEMEAERASLAFEALSPEEKTAVMQQVQQQQTQEAQMAAQQQPSQEEMLMAQQQDAGIESQPMDEGMMQQQMMGDGSQANVGMMPQMAYGGEINKFDEGGDLDPIAKALFKRFGFNTMSDFYKWQEKNGIDYKLWRDANGKGINAWKKVFADEAFRKAVNDPAFFDALDRGYDFGEYNPEQLDKATIQSISRGNWKTTNGRGWRGSEDMAFKQATKGMSDKQIDALTTEQLAELMRNTDAYKNTSKWLENSDNALLYLNTLLNDPETPEVAKQYARKFVQDGKWKDGFTYDYGTVFGKDGKGVRETNPGTYWHSVAEANRGNQMKNLVWNRDKKGWEEIIGDVPSNLALNSTYAWNDPSNQYTYNYYTDPRTFHAMDGDDYDGYIEGELGPNVGAEVRRETLPNGDTVIYHTRSNAPAGDTAGTMAGNGDGRRIVPVHRAEWPRYAGLFGPAVGLGMQALGIGKPDTSRIDAAVEAGNGPAYLASPHLIGDYMKPRVWDQLFYGNRLQANANATNRSIVNAGGNNRGTVMSGLLANAASTFQGLGNMDRQGEEFNWNNYKDTKTFNRGTNQYNADVLNRVDQFNADALNRQRQYSAQLRMDAARQKMAADADWYNGIYGNVAGLFKGLGDLGTENFRLNRVADLWADGVGGTVSDKTNTSRPYVKSGAQGGKLKRKKGKRGLTY